ncbi:MAG: hypothetical protein HY847_02425 [Betaproteobacteria bacterium]|nr:hypothetical protein [Betaproteobacteria bacterium]
MNIEILLKRSVPGAKKTVEDHIARGQRIAEAIQKNFNISEPWQWQAKHLRWMLQGWANKFSLATQKDYWRTARVLASALDHWPDWEPYLRGQWSPHGVGGRPAKLARGRTDKSKD